MSNFDSSLGVEFWMKSAVEVAADSSTATYADIDAVIVVYDLNAPESLEHVVSVWRPFLAELSSRTGVILTGIQYDKWLKSSEIFGQIKPSQGTSWEDGQHVRSSYPLDLTVCLYDAVMQVAELIGATYFICVDAETRFGISAETPDVKCQDAGMSMTLQAAIIKLGEHLVFVPMLKLCALAAIAKHATIPTTKKDKAKDDSCRCVIA